MAGLVGCLVKSPTVGADLPVVAFHASGRVSRPGNDASRARSCVAVPTKDLHSGNRLPGVRGLRRAVSAIYASVRKSTLARKRISTALRGVFWSLIGVGSALNIDARLVAVLQHEASLLSRLERGDHVGGYRIGCRIGRRASNTSPTHLSHFNRELQEKEAAVRGDQPRVIGDRNRLEQSGSRSRPLHRDHEKLSRHGRQFVYMYRQARILFHGRRLTNR